MTIPGLLSAAMLSAAAPILVPEKTDWAMTAPANQSVQPAEDGFAIMERSPKMHRGTASPAPISLGATILFDGAIAASSGTSLPEFHP